MVNGVLELASHINTHLNVYPWNLVGGQGDLIVAHDVIYQVLWSIKWLSGTELEKEFVK